MIRKILTYVFLLLAMMMSAAEMPDSGIRVSLVTLYPGSEVYEVYGHTELRVQDSYGDFFYNYGLFDFNSPGFVYRFVKGETDYLCGAVPAAYATRGYTGRRIVEQVLNLSAAQARKVRDLLVVNAMPENATYRYKFVSDNCATRPRDIIERVLGDSLKYHPEAPSTVSFRQMMHRYNANYAWNQFGIDLALGADLDTTITYRQQMFAPLVLMDAFSRATVATAAGTEQPLVASTVVLSDYPADAALMPPTPWYRSPLFAALMLVLLAVAMAVHDVRKRHNNRLFHTLLYSVYSLMGAVIFYLVFVSTHEFTSPNYHALWLHPLYVVLAILPWVRKSGKVLFILHLLNVAWLTVLLVQFASGFISQEISLTHYLLMLTPIVPSVSYILVNRLCNRAKVK
ncbi:MAG: DUF4105 domain-containing protein [bacterium]|nr:DUF4105 domain-containing protein [bacterium]